MRRCVSLRLSCQPCGWPLRPGRFRGRILCGDIRRHLPAGKWGEPAGTGLPRVRGFVGLSTWQRIRMLPGAGACLLLIVVNPLPRGAELFFPPWRKRAWQQAANPAARLCRLRVRLACSWGAAEISTRCASRAETPSVSSRSLCRVRSVLAPLSALALVARARSAGPRRCARAGCAHTGSLGVAVEEREPAGSVRCTRGIGGRRIGVRARLVALGRAHRWPVCGLCSGTTPLRPWKRQMLANSQEPTKFWRVCFSWKSGCRRLC